MFFIIKTAFWLALVVMLLPSDDNSQYGERVSTGEAIYAAQTVVADMSDFCARNPQTCETGQAALKTFSAKAQYGAKLVYDYLGDATAEDTVSAGRTVATTRIVVTPDGAAGIPDVTYLLPADMDSAEAGPAPSPVATYTGSVTSIGDLLQRID